MKVGDLAMRLLVGVGGLALVSLVAGAVWGVFLVRQGFSTREAPSSLEVWIARGLRRASVPSQARALRNPVMPSEEKLASARAHWADHCASCHANNGSGDTPVGRNLFPKPPDMRAGSTQAQSDGELYYVIKNGVRLTGMPAWGEPGDEDLESWALVAFIRHLPNLSPEEEYEMKKLNPQSVHQREERVLEDAFLNNTDLP